MAANFTPHEVKLEGHILHLKSFGVDGHEGLFALTIAEKWGMTKEEIKAALECYPDCAVGAYTSDGTLICGCCCIPLDAETAYLAILITHESYRNKGIGRYALQQAILKMGDRNVITDATFPALNFYKREGFTPNGERTYKIMGVPAYNRNQSAEPSPFDAQIISSSNIDAVADYLRSVVNIEMSQFVKKLWDADEDVIYQSAAVQDSTIRGTICVRVLPYGSNLLRVSCFYADSYEAAKFLLVKAIEKAPEGASFRFYCPSMNEGNLPRLLREFGMDKREYAQPEHDSELRCYTKSSPHVVNYEKVYSYSNSFINLI